MVEAWRDGRSVEHSHGPGTSLLGLGHPFPAAGEQALDVMRATGGVGLVASDEASYEAEGVIATTEGLFLQPASSIPVAALRDPVNAHLVKEMRDQLIVVIGTATGKNQFREPLATLRQPPRVTGGIDEFVALNPDLRD